MPMAYSLFLVVLLIVGTVDSSLVGVGARVTVEVEIAASEPTDPPEVEIRLARRGYDERRAVVATGGPLDFSAVARFNVREAGFYRMIVYDSDGRKIGGPSLVRVRPEDLGVDPI